MTTHTTGPWCCRALLGGVVLLLAQNAGYLRSCTQIALQSHGLGSLVEVQASASLVLCQHSIAQRHWHVMDWLYPRNCATAAIASEHHEVQELSTHTKCTARSIDTASCMVAPKPCCTSLSPSFSTSSFCPVCHCRVALCSQASLLLCHLCDRVLAGNFVECISQQQCIAYSR